MAVLRREKSMEELIQSVIGYPPTKEQVNKVYGRYGNAKAFEHRLFEISMMIPWKSDKEELAMKTWLEKYNRKEN